MLRFAGHGSCVAAREHELMQPALLLDAMGTLLRLDDPVGRLRAELSARFGVTVSVARAGEALRAEIAHYRTHMLRGRDPASLAALRAECAGVLAAELGPPFSAADPDGVTGALLAALRFTAFPDVGPALAEVRRAVPGVRIVVVSNWDAGLPEVLAEAGLADGLDGVVTSAGVGTAKPDPAIFRAGLALAGARPGEALHVGDSVDEDVAGARAAGIAAVLLRRDGPRPVEPPEDVPVVSGLGGIVSYVTCAR